jgi:hypothetical protein
MEQNDRLFLLKPSHSLQGGGQDGMIETVRYCPFVLQCQCQKRAMANSGFFRSELKGAAAGERPIMANSSFSFRMPIQIAKPKNLMWKGGG